MPTELVLNFGLKVLGFMQFGGGMQAKVYCISVEGGLSVKTKVFRTSVDSNT